MYEASGINEVSGMYENPEEDIHTYLKSVLKDKTMEQYDDDGPAPRNSHYKKKLLNVYTKGLDTINTDQLEIGYDMADNTPPLDLRAINNAFYSRVANITAEMGESSDAGVSQRDITGSEVDAIRHKSINTIKNLLRYNQANAINGVHKKGYVENNPEFQTQELDTSYQDQIRPTDDPVLHKSAFAAETEGGINIANYKVDSDFKTSLYSLMKSQSDEQIQNRQFDANTNIQIHDLVDSSMLQGKVRSLKDYHLSSDVEHEFIPGISTIFKPNKSNTTDASYIGPNSVETENSFNDRRVTSMLKTMTTDKRKNLKPSQHDSDELKKTLNVLSQKNSIKNYKSLDTKYKKLQMGSEDFNDKAKTNFTNPIRKSFVTLHENPQSGEIVVDASPSMTSNVKKSIVDIIRRAKTGSIDYVMKSVPELKQVRHTNVNDSTYNKMTGDVTISHLSSNSLKNKSGMNTGINAGTDPTYSKIGNREHKVIQSVLKDMTVKKYKSVAPESSDSKINNSVVEAEMQKSGMGGRNTRVKTEKGDVDVNKYDIQCKFENSKTRLMDRGAFITNNGLDSTRMKNHISDDQPLMFEDF